MSNPLALLQSPIKTTRWTRRDGKMVIKATMGTSTSAMVVFRRHKKAKAEALVMSLLLNF